MINNSFYSQFGEDRIISLALGILQSKGIISEISYLDIGGNRAKEISNTYYFYLRGCKGCVIEPNPRLASKFKEVRPQDNVLNIYIDNTDECIKYDLQKHVGDKFTITGISMSEIVTSISSSSSYLTNPSSKFIRTVSV